MAAPLSTPRESGSPQPGASLLDRLRAAITKHVAFPSPEAADAVVLWTAASHAQPAWEHAPRLAVISPIRGCGKTRVLEVVRDASHRPINTSDATIAALFRSIDAEDPPTLVLDEADAKFGSRRQAESNEDLRALLNAGHKRGNPVLRCVGSSHTPTEFPSFAMAALASIGSLPDTIMDRSIVIRMQKRSPNQYVAPYRSRRDGDSLKVLGAEIGRWTQRKMKRLRKAAPDMPVEDRAADVWEPLVAIADAAGGEWPDRAREAATALSAESEEAAAEQVAAIRLLADLRIVLEPADAKPRKQLWTRTLLRKLRAIPESSWDGGMYNESLTDRELARLLRDFGIRSRDLRGTDRETGRQVVRKGYLRRDFIDVWARYLPDVAQGSASRESSEPRATSDVAVVAEVAEPADVSDAPTRAELLEMVREVDFVLLEVGQVEVGGSRRDWKAFIKSASALERAWAADAIEARRSTR